ncbi:MAG TPA: PD-(D/E)XK nuclease family protein [Steroidobacteraceae bacterium]|nr:PD-(D/E)XK nuclease family protein [Steroidobacteraceae bacterium]
MTSTSIFDDAAIRDGVTFVVPTRRLAYHLKARHDAACLARGLVAWRTPDVVTWPVLVRRLFDADRVAGHTRRRWLAPSLSRAAWERIVRRDPQHAQVLAPAGLGAVAQGSWGLLHEYCIPVAALTSEASVETVAFAGWAAAYTDWLDAGDWQDPARAAACVGTPSAGTAYRFVGFERFTPQQQDFVNRCRAAGVLIDVTSHADEETTGPAQLVTCNDFDAEIEAAARWAACRLEQQPDARLALVVPALGRERARLRRVLDRVFVPQSAVTGGPAPESQAYELAAARPLLERPVVAAALAWIDAASGALPWQAVSALLLGAFDGAAVAECHVRAELDVKLRRHRVFVPGLLQVAAAARLAGAVVTAERLERVAERAARWHGARLLPSQWAADFSGLLRDLGWPGVAEDSAEHQAVQRWQALLGEFGASDDVVGALSCSRALAQLRQHAGETAFEPQEIAASLLVIDPDTALGMKFDAVWVCGLDAGRWPLPANPDPFLPRDWQVRQGIPGATAELAEAQARRTLQRLCRAAPQAICSVSLFEDETPLLPSALVEGLPPVVALDAWTAPDATHALYESRPVLETLVDDALPAFAAHEVVKGGSRLLELQAACPFRAAVELRLGGTALEEPVTGIAATERGTLVHSILHAFWDEVRDQARLLAMPVETRVERVTAIAAATLRPLRGPADDVRNRLLDLEQAALVARVLELLELDAQREPFVVAHVEESRTLDVGGVQVRVVLDRVDRLADGSYAFIDYKTGANARPAAWLGERPELPQLPLYARTVAPDEVGAIAFGTVRKGATGYAGFVHEAGVFSALKPFDAMKSPFKEYGDWKALLSEWQRRLDTLAHEHAQGDARLAPNPAKACRHCHLPGLCRSGQSFAAAGEGADDVE